MTAVTIKPMSGLPLDQMTGHWVSMVDLYQLEGIDWQREELEYRMKCPSCGVESVSLVPHVIHEPCIRTTDFFRAHQDMPYGCNQCPAVYCQTDQLTMHLLLHEEQVFRCNHCSALTAQMSEMMHHLMDQHYSQACSVSECVASDVRFYCRNKWMEHVTQVHEALVIQCPHCSKLLIHTENFKKHRSECLSHPQ